MQLSLRVAHHERVFSPLNERVALEFGERTDGTTVNLNDNIALTETIAIMYAAFPHQSYTRKTILGHKGDVHLFVAYHHCFLAIVGLECETLALGVDNQTAVTQQLTTNAGITLCGHRMVVVEIIVTQLKTVKPEKTHLCGTLGAKRAYGSVAVTTPFHLAGDAGHFLLEKR